MGSRLKSTRKHTNMMILADRVPTRDRIALPVRERDDLADRCSKAWPRRTIGSVSGSICKQKRHEQSVRCGAKWPGMASMVIKIEYMRAVGVRGSTGEIGWAHLIGLTGAYSSMPDVHPCQQDLVEPLSVPSETGGCDPKKHMRATGLQNHQAWLALAGCECSNHLNRQRSTHLGRLAWMMSNGT